MLDEIRLQNFKTHRDTTIRLGRLTVLVGPNGSGKSSVLQAVELVGRSFGKYGFGDTVKAFRTGPKQGERPRLCSVSLSGTSGSARRSWSVVVDETVERRASSPPEGVDLRCSLFSPDPRRLAEAVPISDVYPALGIDGYGLAELVATLRLAHEEAFEALQTAVRAVVPQVERIGVRRTQVPYPKYDVVNTPDGPDVAERTAHKIGHELVFQVSGRGGIPASMMSGGTLITVGVLAVLIGPTRPGILLLDDLDHGLHPRAQWELLKQLRTLLELLPELHIIATSHSPDLVDELAPEEVVVMALREDGSTAARPLTECPRSDMLGVLRSGQLWSALGEEWVKAPKESAS